MISDYILLVNGSSRPYEHNARLLRAIIQRYSHIKFKAVLDLSALPLFLADKEKERSNEYLINLRSDIKHCKGVIIATPEYIHGIPAILKNALEWLTPSGELQHKKTIAITYTPHAPRGSKCMLALLETLNGLQAQIICSLQLYQNELMINKDLSLHGEEGILLLNEAIHLINNDVH